MPPVGTSLPNTKWYRLRYRNAQCAKAGRGRIYPRSAKEVATDAMDVMDKAGRSIRLPSETQGHILRNHGTEKPYF
jgi:hypothetical protein